MAHRLAVCSWSLTADSPETLAARAQATGLGHVQLALDPLRRGEWDGETLDHLLGAAGMGIVSGMMAPEGEDYSTLESIRRTGGFRPDERWAANRHAAAATADLARELDLSLVSTHAGFLPEDRADPLRHEMIGRIGEVADFFARRGVRLALETGQERAETLLEVLAELDRPTVGVNFDPANMVLYGMGDPVAALERLAPHVMQIHIKDAIASDRPGETWGSEVPAGEGDVDWPAFFDVVRERLPDVDLVIEREAGEQRVADIRRAVELVRRHCEVAGP